MKAKRYNLLLGDFYIGTSRFQSNIPTRNSNLNPFWIEGDDNITLKYIRRFENIETNAYGTDVLRMNSFHELIMYNGLDYYLNFHLVIFIPGNGRCVIDYVITSIHLFNKIDNVKINEDNEPNFDHHLGA